MFYTCEQNLSQTIYEVSIVDPLDNIVKKEYMKSLLKILTKEEEHVIIQTFYKNRRYVDICRDSIFRWNITKGRISQIKSIAIRKLQLEAIKQCMDLKFNTVADNIKNEGEAKE